MQEKRKKFNVRGDFYSTVHPANSNNLDIILISHPFF